jgi:hypothetical protein
MAAFKIGSSGASWIAVQCGEQLGCEIQEDDSFGSDRRFLLLIRHENRNKCDVSGGRLTRSDRRTEK